MKNVLSNLSDLKSKVDKLGADKLVPVHVDLSKLCDTAKIMSVKRMCIMLRSNIFKIKYSIILT